MNKVFKEQIEMSNEEFQKQYKFPHCDPKVLHAPGECVYCDKYPDRQALRESWGISFTGRAEADKLPCPAEWSRSAGQIHSWPGNVPFKGDE